MGCHNFYDLLAHVGCKIECVTYGDPVVNVAVECTDHNEVLMDYDVDENPELVEMMIEDKLGKTAPACGNTIIDTLFREEE